MDLERRDIFRDRLSASEIKKILRVANLTPRDMLRKKDKAYKMLDLDDASHTDEQIIDYMTRYPGLIRRPIVFAGNRILVGKLEPNTLKSISRK